MAGGLTGTALELVGRYGYVALFAFMFLETSMVFPFLPSEAVVPVAAAVLVSNPVAVGLFSLVAAAGATVGSLFAYHAFGTTGARAATRYGQYVRVSEADVDRSRRWFRRWGETTVLWGRLLPVLRSVVSIPAGFAEMDRRRFLAYSAAGSFLFNFGVAGLVYYGKRESLFAFLLGAANRGLGWGIAHPGVVAAFGCVLAVAVLGWRHRN